MRVSEAHFYASGGDRRYFDKHFKPYLTAIQLSKQGRAYSRAEIDAIAENIETRLRNGRACDEKGVSNAWHERERAASGTDAAGNEVVNKQVDGETIFARLGPLSQEAAEAWLADQIQRTTLAKTRGSRPRVTFREAGAKYLRDNRDRLASIEDAAWHVELLHPWIGDKALDDVHDASLEPFVKHRLEVNQVSLTTVNRSKEVVRRILNLAARSWRHENGMTWLETSPLISIDAKQARKKARKPYPLSWDEEDLFFAELPKDPNRQMARLKVNTGNREEEVCILRWEWEIAVPELNTSLFVIPGAFVKNGGTDWSC